MRCGESRRRGLYGKNSRSTDQRGADGSRTAGKSGAAAAGELKLTATEKTLVQLYRKADSGMKKVVMSLLKGEKPETGEILETLVGGAMNMLGKKK